ncbi:molybdopterin converting factor small subunit [Mycetocola sp. CAN_C7]|uniref:MoaD/ThiS family protein n=1 Tax=Mycetocola sp. CAN_C7 TaxID=2787724 RepID=UPI0018C8FB5C
MTVTIGVRYFAGAAAGVGRTEERRRYAAPISIDSVLGDVERSSESGDDRLGTVLGRCSFIVNGLTTRDRSVLLADGDQLDVLPPFAGG